MPAGVLVGLVMGLGFLAKGPLGVLFPGMIIGLYTLFSRDSSRSLIRFSTMAIALGSLGAVITPWLAASITANGTTFVSHFFGFSNLQRLTESVDGHHQPFWFYIPCLIALCFPWTFQLIRIVPSLPDLFKNKSSSPLLEINRLAAIWLVSGFTFFSLVQTQLPGYILPLLPAVAILTATALTTPQSLNHVEPDQQASANAPAQPLATWMHRLTLVSLTAIASLCLAAHLGLIAAAVPTLKATRMLMPPQGFDHTAATGLYLGAIGLSIYGHNVKPNNKIFVELLAFAIILIAAPQFQKPYFMFEQAPIIHLSEETHRLGGDATVIYALGKPRYSIVNHSRLPVIFSTPGKRPSSKPLSSQRNWESHRNDSHALIIGPCSEVQALPQGQNSRLRLLDRESDVCLAALDRTTSRQP